MSSIKILARYTILAIILIGKQSIQTLINLFNCQIMLGKKNVIGLMKNQILLLFPMFSKIHQKIFLKIYLQLIGMRLY